jgi:hypothetical protein
MQIDVLHMHNFMIRDYYRQKIGFEKLMFSTQNS